MYGWSVFVGLDFWGRRRLARENGDEVEVEVLFVVVAMFVVASVVVDVVVLVVVVVVGAGNPDCEKKGCPELSIVFSRLMST